jgi:hypothetical protein
VAGILLRGLGKVGKAVMGNRVWRNRGEKGIGEKGNWLGDIGEKRRRMALRHRGKRKGLDWEEGDLESEKLGERGEMGNSENERETGRCGRGDAGKIVRGNGPVRIGKATARREWEVELGDYGDDWR